MTRFSDGDVRVEWTRGRTVTVFTGYMTNWSINSRFNEPTEMTMMLRVVEEQCEYDLEEE